MLLLGVIFLFGNLLAAYGADTPFKCVYTDEDCPSKMCFYSIDHEKRCYRAGCADEELCRGRRNNECFMSNSLHMCCCFDDGCAAGYKGLNDCVDEPKNSTEAEAVTSATDVTTTSTLAATANISTVAPTTPEKLPAPSTAKTSDTSTEETVSTNKKESAEVRDETEPAVSPLATTSTESSTSSTSTSTQKSAVSETQASSAATTSTSSTTKKQQSTTAKTTTKAVHPVTSRITTSTSTARTTRYTKPVTTTTSTSTRTTTTTKPSTTTTTTTTTSPTTTTTTTTTIAPPVSKQHIPLGELRPLPDLPQSEYKAAKPAMQRMPIEVSTTTTRSASSYPKVRVESFAEQREATESGGFFSPAMRDDQQQKTRKSSGDEKKATSSLITVYEVTTQAVKNRESQEEWKAPVPWWAAVVLGFLVSVIAAWIVVFILRKKRAREAETPNRATEKEKGLVDPLLRTSEENSRLSENSRI